MSAVARPTNFLTGCLAAIATGVTSSLLTGNRTMVQDRAPTAIRL